MEKNSNQDFLRELFNHIADKEPVHICTRKGNRYDKEYWKYKNIRICVTKERISRELISISLTKL